MVITLGRVPYIHHFIHQRIAQQCITVAHLVFWDLESLKVSVLDQAWRSETKVRLRHKNTCDRNVIAWGTPARIKALSSDFQGAWHMTYRHLITWLLDFYILKRHKFTWSNSKSQLTFNLIDFTFVAWAFNQRIKLLLADDLVHFKATDIAYVHRHLHLRLHIGCPHHDTFDGNQGSDLLGSDLTHLAYMFLWELSMYDKHLVNSL